MLACGGLARTDLHASLQGRVPELHLVGDAWAPRRLTIATREAWELARTAFNRRFTETLPAPPTCAP